MARERAEDSEEEGQNFCAPAAYMRWCVLTSRRTEAMDAVTAALSTVATCFPGVVARRAWKVVETADDGFDAAAFLKDVAVRPPRYNEKTDAEEPLPAPPVAAKGGDEAKDVDEEAKMDTFARRAEVENWSRWQRHRVGLDVPMFHTLCVVLDAVDEELVRALDAADGVHVLRFAVQARVEEELDDGEAVEEESEEEESEEEDEFMVWVEQQAAAAAATARAARVQVAVSTVAAQLGRQFRAFIKDEARMRRQSWIAWARVGRGRVAVYKRPEGDDVAWAAKQGMTMIVSLVWDDRAVAVRDAAKAAGVKWLWCPLGENSNSKKQMRAFNTVWNLLLLRLQQAAAEVRRGGSVLVHCSAGLNRSGLFAYALFRTLGLRHAGAVDAITATRPVTNRNIGKVRYLVGADVVAHWRDHGAVDAEKPLEDVRDMVAEAVDVASTLNSRPRDHYLATEAAPLVAA